MRAVSDVVVAAAIYERKVGLQEASPSRLRQGVGESITGRRGPARAGLAARADPPGAGTGESQ